MSVPALPRNPQEGWITVGRIGAPYGVKGWNHVQSFCRPIEKILQYSPWYLQRGEEWVDVEREQGRQHGQSLVVKLRGVDNREQAAGLTQSMISIRADQRETLPAGVFYWTDLEGLAVELVSGEKIGHIRHLYDNAGTEVMIIDDRKGREQHVPFIMNETVLAVDIAKGWIRIDWCFDYPEG